MLERGYDFVVVGAGTAGCVIAAGLARDAQRSVLLVEAGPDYSTMSALPEDLLHGASNFASVKGARHNWSFEGTATGQRNIHVPRGRVVGGSGAINGQVFLRGLPEDYEAWSQCAGPVWSYEAVLPALKALECDMDFGAEPHHGASGMVPVRRYHRDTWLPVQEAFFDACRDADLPDSPDLNDPTATGVGALPFNTVDGVRMSSALTHLAGARGRKNLTILADSVVSRILFDRGRAVAVEVWVNGEKHVIKGSEIICCAGVFGSPQLLMRSGVGAAKTIRGAGLPLRLELAGVGQNLHDHPSVALRFRVKPGTALDPYAPRYQVALRFTLAHRNEGHILPASYSYGDPLKPLEPEGIRFLCMLGKPESRGEVRISSDQPGVQPIINFNFLGEPSDGTKMAEIVARCRMLAASKALGRLVADQIVSTPDDRDGMIQRWLPQNVTTTHHAGGTCKMGPATDPLSVVDPHCRVHGVAGLRVIDASVIPMPMTSHINATVLVLAERAVRWLSNGR